MVGMFTGTNYRIFVLYFFCTFRTMSHKIFWSYQKVRKFEEKFIEKWKGHTFWFLILLVWFFNITLKKSKNYIFLVTRYLHSKKQICFKLNWKETIFRIINIQISSRNFHQTFFKKICVKRKSKHFLSRSYFWRENIGPIITLSKVLW